MMYSLAALLEVKGKLTEALPLFMEELAGCAARYGNAHGGGAE